MVKRHGALAIVAGLVAMTGCTAGKQAASERLFFAAQIEQDGVVLARPRLLGEVGRPVSMKLVDPDRPELTRLALDLRPEATGDGYRIGIGLELPGEDSAMSGKLELLHGEERRLQLSAEEHPVSVRLMVLRVDSPEFQALMDLSRNRSEVERG